MSHGRQTVDFNFTPYFPRSGDRGYSRLEQDDMLKYVPFVSDPFSPILPTLPLCLFPANFSQGAWSYSRHLWMWVRCALRQLN